MKARLALLLFSTCIVVISAFAQPTAQVPVDRHTLDRLVDQYFAQSRASKRGERPSEFKASGVASKDFHLDPRCDERPHQSPSNCIDQVCERLGSFGCDDAPEVERAARICRCNYGGSCVATVCRKLGSFGCDDVSEIERVARTCAGE